MVFYKKNLRKPIEWILIGGNGAYTLQKIEPIHLPFFMYSTNDKMPSKTVTSKQPLRRSKRLAAKAVAAAAAEAKEAEKAPKPVVTCPYVIMSSFNDQLVADRAGRFSIHYWELYTDMFDYFWNNMIYFRDNLEYIQDTLRWAIEVTELAAVTPQSRHTDFMRVVKDVIFRATILLHSNGRCDP
jgi:hypothetical protein